MRKQLFPKHYGDRFDDSPVANWLHDFSDWLGEADYCATAHRGHVMVVRRVLEQQRALPADRRFGARELHSMFRSPIRPKSFAGTRWAFEQYLRARGRWIEPEQDEPYRALISSYRTHMCDLAGLAPTTVEQKLRTARRFLSLTCAPPKALADLAPRDVERYVARRARRLGRGALQNDLGNVRALLKFCQERGLCGAGLDQIDLSVRYRDEKPPRAIPWILVESLLASIDRSTPMGCRDHAAMHLMAYYGLRTGEIGDLRLDDLDTRRRILHVRQAKVRGMLSLPLSIATARILARYVRFGRPRTARPELFLSVAAPLAPFSRSALAEAFRRHVHRSGLPLNGSSPYGLRHAFAMRLLERGVGVPAIGQLLGHGSIESTAVYLRLHTSALREVALPVPTSFERRVS